MNLSQRAKDGVKKSIKLALGQALGKLGLEVRRAPRVGGAGGVPPAEEGHGSKRDRSWSFDPEFLTAVEKSKTSVSGVEPMSAQPKLLTTYSSVKYVVQNKIPGALVECGVYQGRHVRLMLETLKAFGDTSRDVFLYDTFAGMTEPGTLDFKPHRKLSAETNRANWLANQQNAAHEYNEACAWPLEAVQRYIFESGYPKDKIHFIQGDIRQTVPAQAPQALLGESHGAIAVFRIDLDWHDLIKHVLDAMYGSVVRGGVVISDDYGTWFGAKKAFDDFLKSRELHPLLFRTDLTERAFLAP